MFRIFSEKPRTKETTVLILSVFIAGLCSIIYELLIGTTSSYFLGDSVKQFSLTIGMYMAAMGLGSYFSRMISDENLLVKFIGIEIFLGFLGGISVPALYFTFAFTDLYPWMMVLMTMLIGICIGLEIPLLTRVMEQYYVLKVNLSNVLSLDYLGALIATLIFPFILLPFLGTFRSSIFFGLINMLIGFLVLWGFSDQIGFNRKKLLLTANILACGLLVFMLMVSNWLLESWTQSLYQDRVVYSKQSNYQKIVLTKDKDDYRLYLDGNLQFSTIDEYRYHEALVHIPLGIRKASNVLLLGGGDGLAVREVLKHSTVQSVTLVDLDPEITGMAKENPHLKRINESSLENSKVSVLNQDAFVYLNKTPKRFDLIIADLPDPNNSSLSRLYSREFYMLVRSRLAENGIFITQSTSPFYARKAFWSIGKSLQNAGFSNLVPYHVNVPSFGDWGFMMASNAALNTGMIQLQVPTRFLNREAIPGLFVFEKDLIEKDVQGSSLDQPKILTYYLEGWRYWN